MAASGRRAAAALLAAAVGAAGVPVGAASVAAPDGPVARTSAPAPARQQELLRLLRQDCGSCHGMRLTGGLGPALTPEALSARPEAGLVATIVAGRPGTAMPPWRRFLSEAEAQWLVVRLVSGDVETVRD